MAEDKVENLVLLWWPWYSGGSRLAYAFGIGGSLGLALLLLRLKVPEGPRWLMLRGKEEEADKVVSDVERRIEGGEKKLPTREGEKLRITVRDHTPRGEIFRNMAGETVNGHFSGWR